MDDMELQMQGACGGPRPKRGTISGQRVQAVRVRGGDEVRGRERQERAAELGALRGGVAAAHGPTQPIAGRQLARQSGCWRSAC